MARINHRPHCKQEGKCIRCGRPICDGCNAEDKNGIYGICMVCNAKDLKIKEQTLLPLRPLLFNRKKIKRYYKTCNDNRNIYDYIMDEMIKEAQDEFENGGYGE